MIKKLDILIIRSFVGPFLATFLIALFVLTMQFFWLYIDDMVGKGIDFLTLINLIGVVIVYWVPLALPLALLLSSIMTFGNLGETFEIVAIKSAGIPLLRFMRPLLILTIFISGIAFLFANNVIPVAQLRLESIKHDIIVTKPAFDIKEGVFYNKIDGYVIKIGKKDADNSTIHNVIIFEKYQALQDNLIVAESGIMRVTPDKKFLEFVLYNGCRYQEKGQWHSMNTDFIRLSFKEYKKVFDLASFTMNKTEDDAYKYDPKMLSIRQLNATIDSLKKSENMFYKRTDAFVSPYYNLTKYFDTTKKVISSTDSIKLSNPALLNIPDSQKNNINERAFNQIHAVISNLDVLSEEYRQKQDAIRLHEIEWHRKFTLSVACIVLFLIGAPLGSIIRKGGLGLPLVFAIIFFVIFHLLNTFGEKFAREAITTPFGGMWLPIFVLLPVGAFLTYKAMKDSQLFNQEYYYRFFKKINLMIKRFKTVKPNS